ncbi:MAG TPA: phosphoribosylanthranilate isomerase [Roseiarcus sp.]|jgi:phosphoribosylanthranilate isomerase|nr:phosphoribosylanthranilate isomerase [Roseiarcus sp.]
MSSIVKICGLSTPSSLEAALVAGADMVGFVFFEKSPRHVSLDQAAELGRKACGRAKIVALTVDAGDAALEDIVAALAPDVLQLHGRETPVRVAAIGRTFGVATMKAIGVAADEDLAAAKDYAGVADLILFDAKPPKDARLPGGNGAPFDWRLLEKGSLDGRYLLSGGLDADNVAEAIVLSGALGVDVSSGVESAPGVKDNSKIAVFVARARDAFAGRRASATFAGRVA